MPGVEWWNEVARKALVGRKIVSARYKDVFGDGTKGITFKLDDGTEVVVSQDDEGNGPGSLFLDPPKDDGTGCLPVIRHYRNEED